MEKTLLLLLLPSLLERRFVIKIWECVRVAGFSEAGMECASVTPPFKGVTFVRRV